MRLRRLVLVGVILAVLGVIVALVSVLTASATQTIPQSPSARAATIPPLIGGGTFQVSWSGAASSTQVTIAPCSDSTCSSVGSPVGQASGSSGSISVSVQGGKTYALTETGASGGLSVTVSLSGITLPLLAGIVLVAVGALVVLVGFRRGARADLAAPAVEEEPAYGSESPGMVTGGAPVPPVVDAAAGWMTSGAPVSASPVTGPTQAPVYTPPSAAPPPSTPGGGRPAVKCATCGTMNEPWITNCRWCKRPLASTGQA